MKSRNLDGSEDIDLPPLLTLQEIPLNMADIPQDQDSPLYLQNQGVKIYPVDGPIEILLGSNAAQAMEPLEVVRSQQGGPFAVRTRLGWILGGAKNASHHPTWVHLLKIRCG